MAAITIRLKGRLLERVAAQLEARLKQRDKGCFICSAKRQNVYSILYMNRCF